MPTNCLVGCSNGEFDPVIDGMIATPFVICQFGGSGQPVLTVGNKSISSNNGFKKLGIDSDKIKGGVIQTAHVKSFEFGYSTGSTQTIEITDEIGGDFHTFADRLVTQLDDKTLALPGALVQFGWIYTDNNGNTGKVKKSTTLFGTMVGMDVAFEFGRVNYTIKMPDLMQLAFTGGITESYTNTTLGDAITALLKKTKQRPLFVKKGPDNKKTYLNPNDFFEIGDKKMTLIANGMNPIDTINSWIKPFVTKDKKGCTLSSGHEAGVDEDVVYILQDPQPNKDEGTTTSKPIAQYMVNGGNCSDVISFSPKINFPAAFAAIIGSGGSMSAGVGTTTINNQSEKDPNVAGQPSAPSTGNAAIQAHGPNAAIEVQKGDIAQQKAGTIMAPEVAAVSAELKIKGDPSDRYTTPCIAGSFVSLTVINPFGITFANNSVSWSHLTASSCNDVLSNPNWMLQGVNHSIREGSYTTTLSLFLVVPQLSELNGDQLGLAQGAVGIGQ